MASYTEYDFVGITYASTADTYVFYRGGTSGTLKQTIVLVYSGTDKTVLKQVIET